MARACTTLFFKGKKVWMPLNSDKTFARLLMEWAGWHLFIFFFFLKSEGLIIGIRHMQCSHTSHMVFEQKQSVMLLLPITFLLCKSKPPSFYVERPHMPAWCLNSERLTVMHVVGQATPWCIRAYISSKWLAQAGLCMKGSTDPTNFIGLCILQLEYFNMALHSTWPAGTFWSVMSFYCDSNYMDTSTRFLPSASASLSPWGSV